MSSHMQYFERKDSLLMILEWTFFFYFNMLPLIPVTVEFSSESKVQWKQKQVIRQETIGRGAGWVEE